MVLCVDEKSQIQALERSQPLLPIGVGYVEGVTHDYRRHGTTTLFAALNIETGTVISQCRQRHRHREYLDFLRRIDAAVPRALDVHIIVDNYSTHKHVKIKRWMAARPRFHVHFIPTYSSWLNQVEIWFNRITQHAIRRGTFSSVKELVNRIDQSTCRRAPLNLCEAPTGRSGSWSQNNVILFSPASQLKCIKSVSGGPATAVTEPDRRGTLQSNRLREWLVLPFALYARLQGCVFYLREECGARPVPGGQQRVTGPPDHLTSEWFNALLALRDGPALLRLLHPRRDLRLPRRRCDRLSHHQSMR